jgi:hypothetical protein
VCTSLGIFNEVDANVLLSKIRGHFKASSSA